MSDRTKPLEVGITNAKGKSSFAPGSPIPAAVGPRTYLPRRAPRAGARCASSPASSSAAASALSWTPRGSCPQTPACVQNGEYTNTDLQQKGAQLSLTLSI